MDPYGTQVSSSSYVTSSIIGLVVAIFLIIATWKVFTKAGRPGWAAIIPIYNAYVMLKVVGRPGWWLILYIIPIVNIVISIIVAIDLAKAFGKGGAFGFFLCWLIPIIGIPVLGFGDAQYVRGNVAQCQPV